MIAEKMIVYFLGDYIDLPSSSDELQASQNAQFDPLDI